MITLGQLGVRDTKHGRRWLAIGLALVVLAVSVPVGLNALRTPSPASTGSLQPASGGSFEQSPGLGSDAGAKAIAPTAPDTAGGPAREETPASGTAGSAVPPVGPKLARTAWLGVKVANVTKASAQVRAIADAAGGQVLSESIVTATDPTGSYGSPKSVSGMPEDAPVPPVGLNEARLTLSVPADKLDPVLADLSSANLGTVSYRSSQSVDVTATYTDTQARIEPAKDSIARVRALMVKATSLEQIVLLESELSRRQADLDSLQQQLAELDRRTTMSEVSVSLWTDETSASQPNGNGFLAGVQKAWDALLNSLVVVLTGLAVLLPWLLIALVVAWFIRRWLGRRGSRGGVTPTTTTD
ncbi:DUF4349 domain-containing protein [Intrasporangium sp.]|jgi:hypothetical protein|uniref:DUF4349 domain-containing protein n=1 Tax=Intrasporangium sp. TaxID=1925024 RepID=UPI0033653D01